MGEVNIRTQLDTNPGDDTIQSSSIGDAYLGKGLYNAKNVTKTFEGSPITVINELNVKLADGSLEVTDAGLKVADVNTMPDISSGLEIVSNQLQVKLSTAMANIIGVDSEGGLIASVPLASLDGLTPGLVKPGENIDIDPEGTINANTAPDVTIVTGKQIGRAHV